MYRSRLHYLVTWSTRGRRPVMKDRHAVTLESLIRTLCEERGFEVVDLAVGLDHVHVLMGLRPAQSIASAIRELKGRTSVVLLERHPELRVWLGGNLVWDERYAVETVSASRLERVQSRLHTVHRSHHRVSDESNLARAS
ncbi:MAG: IS200/IS605 family transposase [Candidatus Eisenbacteria bacterium]|uniref:IS200/IS605 family transposase n=1 Tax=Eiseniibacteriota bacterium TaxID=2212470 RepID=A0A849SDM2_UNCEI|nr:IS200/IS605 family transposase [Candidatus Eisenbacteria bacterium]